MDPLTAGGDHRAKHARVVEVLDRAGGEAVLLQSPAAVNWLLDGARTHVSLAAAPVVAVRVDRAGCRVLVARSEAPRLRAEELPGGLEVQELDWWEDATRAGGDALPESAVDAPLRAARGRLLAGETSRYRRLCADVAAIATDVLALAVPTMTERHLASGLSGALVASGIDPLVVLVGGDARVAHRHPLPTDAVIGRRALVVVCGRRDGLVANLSRWVREGAESDAERDRTRRIREVEAAYWDALADGRPLAEVLLAGAGAYALAGFEADEWTRHHQGGVAGYNGRDPRATPTIADTVRAPQAFAWNPSAPGAKVEDTILFDGHDVEILTVDPRWPSSEHRGRPRPDEWIMPAR